MPLRLCLYSHPKHTWGGFWPRRLSGIEQTVSTLGNILNPLKRVAIYKPLCVNGLLRALVFKPFLGIILKTARWHGTKWYQRRLYKYTQLYFNTFKASLRYSSSTEITLLYYGTVVCVMLWWNKWREIEEQKRGTDWRLNNTIKLWN